MKEPHTGDQADSLLDRLDELNTALQNALEEAPKGSQVWEYLVQAQIRVNYSHLAAFRCCAAPGPPPKSLIINGNVNKVET